MSQMPIKNCTEEKKVTDGNQIKKTETMPQEQQLFQNE